MSDFKPEKGIVVEFRGKEGTEKKVYTYRDKSEERDGFLVLDGSFISSIPGYYYFAKHGRLNALLRRHGDSDYGPRPSSSFVDFTEDGVRIDGDVTSPVCDTISPERSPKTIAEVVKLVRGAYTLVTDMCDMTQKGWATIHALKTNEDVHIYEGEKLTILPDSFREVMENIRGCDWRKEVLGFNFPGRR